MSEVEKQIVENIFWGLWRIEFHSRRDLNKSMKSNRFRLMYDRLQTKVGNFIEIDKMARAYGDSTGN